MRYDLLLTGGTVVLPDGCRAADVAVRDGRIEEVGTFPELRAAGRGFSAAWADYERTVISGEGAQT